MDNLVGYGSDEDYDIDRRENYTSGSRGGGVRRRDDDTNYDDVNMDLSEESQQEESEPELPQVEHNRHGEDRRSREGSNRDSNSDSSERRRDSPASYRRDRSPRRDDKRSRNEHNQHSGSSSSRRGLLGDRPDDYRNYDNHKVPSMEMNSYSGDSRSHDTRDAVSPRFVDRDRRERERERDRERHNRRSEERSSRRSERRSRSRERYDKADKYKPRNAYPPPPESDGRSPNGPSHYHSASYKVNKKLDVMEKMGLQIKTPDGSMTTAQQLRQATIEPGGLPAYCTTNNVNANRIMDQVQKRKLLWSNKSKNTQAEAATWSGTKFAQDNDGKQAEKFMRLMGIKEPVKPTTDKPCDPNKKQEEMFQAMQAQYEVARATTHTMRGVGLGFQRGQF